MKSPILSFLTLFFAGADFSAGMLLANHPYVSTLCGFVAGSLLTQLLYTEFVLSKFAGKP